MACSGRKGVLMAVVQVFSASPRLRWCFKSPSPRVLYFQMCYITGLQQAGRLWLSAMSSAAQGGQNAKHQLFLSRLNYKFHSHPTWKVSIFVVKTVIDLLGHYQAVYTPKINLGEGSKLLIKCDNITPNYVHDRVEFGLLTARMGGF